MPSARPENAALTCPPVIPRSTARLIREEAEMGLLMGSLRIVGAGLTFRS